MDKLKLNLIPLELKEQAKKEAKRSLVVRISLGLLGLLILITFGVLAAAILQGLELSKINAQLDQHKTEVASLKDKEAVISFLKNRIDAINTFTNNRYKQAEILELVERQFPGGVNLVALHIDKSTKVLVQAQTSDTKLLKQFIDTLTDPQNQEGKIASVSAQNVNLSQDGKINFDLQLILSKEIN